MLLLLQSSFFQVSAQQILLLEKAGTVNNYKYHPGDMIILKVKGEKNTIKGSINKLTDTSLVIDYSNEIKFSNITDVYRPMWVRHWVPELLIKASVGYFLVVVINNILQKVYPILPKDVLVATVVLAGAGAGLSYLLVKHYKIRNGWRIRLIDFDKLQMK